jgi:predicted nucleic acid-binding protein
MTAGLLPNPLRLAIDTNVFVLLLAYQYLTFENSPALARARILDDIRGRGDDLLPDRYDELWQIFRRASRRIITQHVVAEAYGLRHRLEEHLHRKELVWRSAITLLREYNVGEESCSIRDLHDREGYRRILLEIGPTDAGLLHVAEQQKAKILTDDRDFLRCAHDRNVHAVSLNQLQLL